MLLRMILGLTMMVMTVILAGEDRAGTRASDAGDVEVSDIAEILLRSCQPTETSEAEPTAEGTIR